MHWFIRPPYAGLHQEMVSICCAGLLLAPLSGLYWYQCISMLGSLGDDDGDGDVNENGSSFLCRHCTTKMLKCLSSRFVKDVNTRQRLPFPPELRYSLLEFNSRKNCHPKWFERDGISVIKFEESPLHFLRDVFVSFAVNNNNNNNNKIFISVLSI